MDKPSASSGDLNTVSAQSHPNPRPNLVHAEHCVPETDSHGGSTKLRSNQSIRGHHASSSTTTEAPGSNANESDVTLTTVSSEATQVSSVPTVPNGLTTEPNSGEALLKEKEEEIANSSWEWSPWLIEVCFLVISFGCFAAIVVVLKIFDGQALPTLSLNLTLNTLIAFLATISKAALMLPIAEAISQCKWEWFRTNQRLSDFQTFDQASRGIWGSMALLRVTRWRNIATLGATVSVVGIVTSPIIQQSLDYPSHLVADETQVAITSVSTYVGPLHENLNDPTGGFPMALALDSLDSLDASASAWSEGLGLRDPISGALEPLCPTGICTFPEMNTLGLCVKQADISSEVVIERISNSSFDDWSWVWGLPSMNNKSWVGTDAWNVTIPAVNFHIATPVPWFIISFPLNESIAFARDTELMRTAIWDGVVIFLAGPNMTIPSYNEYPTPVGHGMEVVFYPCAQRLSVAVDANKVQQNSTVIPTQISAAANGSVYKYICLDRETGEPSTTLQYQECMYTGAVSVDRDAFLVLTDVAEPRQNYTINYDTLFALKGRIGDYFISSWAWNGFDSVFQGPRNCVILIADMVLWTGNSTSVLQVVESKAERFATAATSLFRTWPKVVSDSHAFSGTVWTRETFVHVRWGWISFLAAQLVVGTIFLIFTIYVSSRNRTTAKGETNESGRHNMVLKSSAFAVMFALNEEGRRATGPVQTVRDMSLRAGGLLGRMDGENMIITREKRPGAGLDL